MKETFIIVKVHTALGIFDIYLPNDKEGISRVTTLVAGHMTGDLSFLKGISNPDTENIVSISEAILKTSVIEVIYPQSSLSDLV